MTRGTFSFQDCPRTVNRKPFAAKLKTTSHIERFEWMGLKSSPSSKGRAIQRLPTIPTIPSPLVQLFWVICQGICALVSSADVPMSGLWGHTPVQVQRWPGWSMIHSPRDHLYSDKGAFLTFPRGFRRVLYHKDLESLTLPVITLCQKSQVIYGFIFF